MTGQTVAKAGKGNKRMTGKNFQGIGATTPFVLFGGSGGYSPIAPM
jgi:hypothetical protein